MFVSAAVTFERAQSDLCFAQGSHHHRTDGLGCDIIPWPQPMHRTWSKMPKMPKMLKPQFPRHPSTLEIKLYSPIVACHFESFNMLQHNSQTTERWQHHKPGSHQGRRSFGDHWELSCSKLPFRQPKELFSHFSPHVSLNFTPCVARLSTCPSQRRNITSPASSWRSANYTYQLFWGQNLWCIDVS